MKAIFEDKQFSFQLLRLLGGAVSGASDIGEVISTANRIVEGTTLPAHFYHVGDEKKPVLVLINGFDGTKKNFMEWQCRH